MDFNMPVMNGMNATIELRKMHREKMIDLSHTLIYMHSAIQNIIQIEGLFDGSCKIYH